MRSVSESFVTTLVWLAFIAWIAILLSGSVVMMTLAWRLFIQ